MLQILKRLEFVKGTTYLSWDQFSTQEGQIALLSKSFKGTFKPFKLITVMPEKQYLVT